MMDNTLQGINSGRIPASAITTGKSQAAPAAESQSEISSPSDQVSISSTKDNNQPQKAKKTKSKKTKSKKTDSEKVKVNIFAQDALIDKDKTSVDTIEKSKIGTNLKGPRAYVSDNAPKAIADTDGNFFYEPSQKEFDQVTSFIATYKTLDMQEALFGRKINWVFGNEAIRINSHLKEEPNAYYSRNDGSTNFMYFKSNELGKTIQTAQSADVVSHETGHAILDAIKPKYIMSWGGESRAFHEAFGDCTSMLHTLGHKDNLNGIAQETGGDLKKPSRLSMMAEEFGNAVKRKNDNPNDDNQTYLRDAQNTFTYKPIDQVPEKGPKDQLTAESHSFSRIFSGTFYDALTNVYDKQMKSQPDSKSDNSKITSSLQKAGDKMGHILAKAVDLSPSSSIDFKQAALAMLKADNMLYSGENKKELSDAFIKREVLTKDEIKQFEKDQKNLPDLKLDKDIKTNKEAFEFLDKNARKLGVSPYEFSGVNVHTDKQGNTILEFESFKDISLKSIGKDEIGGLDVFVEITGGMTLAFDKGGKLISKFSDELYDNAPRVNILSDGASSPDEKTINSNKLNEAINAIDNLGSKNLIKNQPLEIKTLSNTDDISASKQKKEPYEAEIVQDPSTGKFKLQRIPIMKD